MKTLLVYVVDSDQREIVDCRIRVRSREGVPLEVKLEDGAWIVQSPSEDALEIEVDAHGFESQEHRVRPRNKITQVVVGLRQPGEISYTIGSNRLALKPDDKSFLLRVRGTGAQERIADLARSLNIDAPNVASTGRPAPDNAYVRMPGNQADAERMIAGLRRAGMDVQALRVIAHGDGPLIGLGNEVAVRFQDRVPRDRIESLIAHTGLRIVRPAIQGGNAYILVREGFPDYRIFDTVDVLNKMDEVVFAEPNLVITIEADQYIPNDPLWTKVPYLKTIKANSAWKKLGDAYPARLGGSTDITIAVIDTSGVSPVHPDLTANLSDTLSKLVESKNFIGTVVKDQVEAELGGDHGNQCAGTATAAFNNGRGLPGVAPNCHLIGARVGEVFDTVRQKAVIDEAQLCAAFLHVAGLDNAVQLGDGQVPAPARVADVISMSCGSSGVLLSSQVQDCLDLVTTQGRGGKGCVVCFSIGNTGHVDFTKPGQAYRAWPSYEKVLGIGSSIGKSPTNPVPKSIHGDLSNNRNNIPVTAETRALYSPYGTTILRKPDLVAPSSTAQFENTATSPPTPAQVDPIFALVRIGTGTNGCTAQAPCMDYAHTFGGTSHSTPAVAGAAALILSANPALTAAEVCEILRKSAVHINPTQTNAFGRWQDIDGDQKLDFSRWYGFGRLDVGAAVQLALDGAPAGGEPPNV